MSGFREHIDTFLKHAFSRPTNTLGEPVIPADIGSWLRSRGLHWSCFGGWMEDSSISAQIIVEAPSTNVHVVCQKHTSGCGFDSTHSSPFYLPLLSGRVIVNLSRVLTTSSLRSTYKHIYIYPPLVKLASCSPSHLLTLSTSRFNRIF